MGGDAASLRKRLVWRCRRGMKELDALLTAYLDTHYEQSGDPEKAAFRSLLELPDPELVGYLLQSKRPESEFESRVVDLILGRTAS